jgi:hypothetical protein
MMTGRRISSIGDMVGNTGSWTQEKLFERGWQLRASGELLGSLRFEKQMGSLALGELADLRITLKREGFLRPRVTLRRAGEPNNLAVFTPNPLGAGHLQIAGSDYRWVCSSFWTSEWSFEDAQGQRILTFKLNSSALRSGAQMTVCQPDPNLGLLALAGWYLLVLSAEDAATSLIMMG